MMVSTCWVLSARRSSSLSLHPSILLSVRPIVCLSGCPFDWHRILVRVSYAYWQPDGRVKRWQAKSWLVADLFVLLLHDADAIRMLNLIWGPLTQKSYISPSSMVIANKGFGLHPSFWKTFAVGSSFGAAECELLLLLISSLLHHRFAAGVILHRNRFLLCNCCLFHHLLLKSSPVQESSPRSPPVDGRTLASAIGRTIMISASGELLFFGAEKFAGSSATSRTLDGANGWPHAVSMRSWDWPANCRTLATEVDRADQWFVLADQFS